VSFCVTCAFPKDLQIFKVLFETPLHSLLKTLLVPEEKQYILLNNTRRLINSGNRVVVTTSCWNVVNTIVTFVLFF